MVGRAAKFLAGTTMSMFSLPQFRNKANYENQVLHAAA